MQSIPSLRTVVVMVAAIAATASYLPAQQVGWKSHVEASASVFFGAVSQRLAVVGTNLSHADSSFETEGSFQFRYGEAADAERDRYVSARSWLSSLSLDATPFATISPFFFGTAESSLEKRIRTRVSGGSGAKWTVARTDRTEASISLAALAEYTRPLGQPTVPVSPTADQTLWRWSWRVKGSRRMGERMTVSHVTFYRPVIDAPSRYTITTNTSVALGLTERMGLSLSLVDNYDSEARQRGAPSNNDGQFLVGLQADF
jgi:hypothetical protein